MHTPSRTINGDPIIRRPLWACEWCQVIESRWVRALHGPQRREQPGRSSIVLMRHGSYTRTLSGRTYVGDPAQTVFYHASDEGRVDHPFETSTLGTTIRLMPGPSLERQLDAAALSGRHVESATFPARIADRSATTERSHRTLLRALAEAGRDEVRVQESMALLFHHAIADMREPDILAGPNASPRDNSRVRTAQEFLSFAYARPLSLDDIARVAGCSPWHLCHLFRRSLGVPVHRYLNRVRLRHAVEQIELGEHSLTRTALTCGFSSHSHFTSAFRREFGSTPSAWRAGLDRITHPHER